MAGYADFDDPSGQSPDGDDAWCPIHALVDDFEDTFRSPEWLNTTGDAVVSALETEGELVMTLAPGAAGSKAYISSQAYDLTGGEVVVEIPEVSTPPSTTFVELRGDTSVIAIRILATIDMMSMEPLYEVDVSVDSKEDPVVPIVTLDYDLMAHRWLRIREADGALFFEHSADGSEWLELGTRSPNDIPVDDLLVAIGVSTTAAAMDPRADAFRQRQQSSLNPDRTPYSRSSITGKWSECVCSKSSRSASGTDSIVTSTVVKAFIAGPVRMKWSRNSPSIRVPSTKW